MYSEPKSEVVVVLCGEEVDGRVSGTYLPEPVRPWRRRQQQSWYAAGPLLDRNATVGKGAMQIKAGLTFHPLFFNHGPRKLQRSAGLQPRFIARLIRQKWAGAKMMHPLWFPRPRVEIISHRLTNYFGAEYKASTRTSRSQREAEVEKTQNLSSHLVL